MYAIRSYYAPWAKTEFDSLDLIWQEQRAKMNDHIANLQKNGASEEEVNKAKAEYDQKSTERDKEVQEYLEASGMTGKVGASYNFV